MATPNQSYILEGPREVLTIGGLTGTDSGTTNSQSFRVVKGSKTVTVFAPNLATDTAIVLEVLTPLDEVHATQTWVALNIVKLDDCTLVAMSFADNKAFTIPTSALGGGLLRWSCSTTQAPAPLKIYMIWNMD